MSDAKSDRQLLEETHDIVIRLETVVLGGNGGDKGLYGKVENQGKELFKLKRYFWTVVGFLAGSGVLVGGLFWGTR